MQGILLVDKPAGWTSFDVVNYVRKIVAQAEDKKPKSVKVGHAGTLDPFATGLLVLLVGKEYTKRAGELSKLDKTYEVTMRLGESSTTGDPEGEITPYVISSGSEKSRQKSLRTSERSLASARDDKKPTKSQIEKVLKQFTGQIQQTPPAYSAIKIDGQRAYKLARAGKEVKIEPREVTVNRLEVTNYDYPEVKFIADVSSGTYIRSLVEDIGQALGTGAYTAALRRTQIDKYDIEGAATVKSISASNLQPILSEL